MKRLLLSVCLGAISLWTHAEAGASTPVRADDIVLPVHPYKMFPEDWDVYAGKYFLSNGQTLVLRRRGLRMYAELANRPPIQLVAAAENVFVSVDRQLKMTLMDDLGHVTGTMVMVVPKKPAQQSEAATESVLLVL
jgi:hypothetical protein